MTTVAIASRCETLRAPARWGAAALLLALGAASLEPRAAHAQPPLTLSERVEAHLLERLAAVQDRPDTELAPFTTDGCSGGLSRGWKYLARRFPGFAHDLGERPPWEACCIEHDRVYWRGRAADGYAARKAADEALRQCVHERGAELGDEVAERWQVTPQEVQAAFDVAGQIMYGVVRVGGRPCTPFPWRWGYGWPACDEAAGAASPGG